MIRDESVRKERRSDKRREMCEVASQTCVSDTSSLRRKL